jgi:subtilisin family serine protease
MEENHGMNVRCIVGWIGWIAIVCSLGSAALAADEPRVIIGLAQPEDLLAQGALQAVGTKIEERGGRMEHVLGFMDAVIARLSPQAIEELQKDPRVRYVVPDGPVATPERWADFPKPGAAELASSATPVELYPWGARRIRAPLVHRAEVPHVSSSSSSSSPLWLLWGMPLTAALIGVFHRSGRTTRRAALLFLPFLVSTTVLLGGCTLVWVMPAGGILADGVQVALLDTGVDLLHPDLRARLLGGTDLVNYDEHPQDDNGHGTGVAGILAASENGQGLIGVAPKVGIWVIKMLDRDEQGSISDLLVGLDWAIRQGAQILSMSLGTPEDSLALREAIQKAHRAGKLLIAAAGNKGSRVLFPAAYPEVIAVAASDRNDQRAWFSNMGPEVELTAPGTDLLSTGLEGGYQIVNGTSFAVPHVAGVAAMLFSLGLRDPAEVRRRLAETAEDLGLALMAQGHGLVDAERAIFGRP